MKLLKKLSYILILPAIFMAAVSCNSFGGWNINYETGFIPDTVTNLESVNTRFDDYNTAGPPTINYNFNLMFSTNRGTEGEKYDLVTYDLWISFNQESGEFYLEGTEMSYPYFYLTELANSEDNEFGPFVIPFGTQDFLFLFSSDKAGSMDIYASYFDQYTFSGGSMADPSPFRLNNINSDKYDAYPAFLPDGSEFYFCSNRDGELDIYMQETSEGDNLLLWTQVDTVFQPEPVAELNSPQKDVCPYINGNLMVFASTRDGGYGGYDLYYSIWSETGWSTPVNFGPKINTEHNEFRPIAFYAYKFDNDLMVFSSDRPGGFGGFDLYYVGIDKLME